MSRLVVIGSSNMDLTAKVRRIPLKGETVMSDGVVSSFGGKGANQAVAARRFGADVVFITKVGADGFGEEMKRHFINEGLPERYIMVQDDVASGQAWICVQDSGENAIVVIPGANDCLTADDVSALRDVIEDADYLLLQLEVPMEAVETAARIAYEAGVKVVLNPAPARQLADSLLRCLYLITPNQGEAMLLTDNAPDPAAALMDKGVENVIITLGEEGSVLRNAHKELLVPSLKVDAVDTVAAGDTYSGTLCAALCEGFSIEDAMALATKASAISVTRCGAQASIPYRDELNW
ncbi:MAG: ribokinase [Bacteroidales bacterium]|nr:ribokinase [Bacteroidales bacterium]